MVYPFWTFKVDGGLEKSAQIPFYPISKKNVQMLDINFKDTKNADHNLKSSEDINLFMIHFFSFYQISEINSIRLSIPMFIGTLCTLHLYKDDL